MLCIILLFAPNEQAAGLMLPYEAISGRISADRKNSQAVLIHPGFEKLFGVRH
jgi:hypothetical protein